jgi:23S rRNA (adenine-N6)-dimethyltransferase
VVAGDLLRIPLPRRRYQVVASIPFSTSSALLHRLLDPPGTALAGADLLLGWGLAARVAAAHPRDLATAW